MLASAAFRHLTLWGWLVVVLTTNQSPLYGAFSVNRCVRAYRESRLLRTHVRSKTPKFSFIGGHTRQLLGVRSGCTRASMPTKPRTRRPDELTMLLVDSRLYLCWLAISASLNPLALIAFRLFSSHHIL